MSSVRPFQQEHIGADLFPAITSGLYKDPLDALREYIQNAIDAKTNRIEITLSKDVISVRDNGTGMPSEQAVGAIRLGVSDKNPIDNVGFRGIGIYSGFEMCDDLEIHTRPQTGECPSMICIHFGKIREMLASEDVDRTLRKPSRLHLLELLSRTVTVKDNPNSPLDEPGTLVMMLGVRGSVSKRLSNTDEVLEYLQNTVPLPFNPGFKYAQEIEDKFRYEDYRVVDVILKTGGRTIIAYRPYSNSMFAHLGKFPVKFYNIESKATKTNYGFIWACINDARKVLSDTKLRGLLIKKYGFSIAGRSYVESFFPRSVIARRVTGEIIVRHNDLIPNAARSDFENSDVRTDFQLALSDCLSKIDRYGEEIQNRLKAIELLDEVSPRIYEIHSLLPKFRRDVDQLLWFNIELADLSRSLETHKDILTQDKPEIYKNTLIALEKAQDNIRDILSRKANAQARKIAENAIQMELEAPGEKETEHSKDRPRTLLGVFESLDIGVDDSVRLAISYIDDNIVRPCLSNDQYAKEMEALREYLEDRI